MLKTYRILSFIVNAFLLFLMSTAFYEKIVEKKRLHFDAIEIVILLVIAFILITSLYFILKTGKVYKKRSINTIKDTLDSELLEIQYFTFTLGKLTSVINFIVGIGFIVMSIFIFIQNRDGFGAPPSWVIFLIPMFFIVYGMLQMYYSYCVFRILRNN